MEPNENDKKAESNTEAKEQKETKDINDTKEANSKEELKLKEEPKKEEIDFKAKYFYAVAEMENVRKRMDREKENLLKYGNEKVLHDLIQVADNFDRTIGMLRGDQDSKVKNLVVGLDMISKQFLDTLAKHGLTSLESVGKPFDPNFHEAIAQEYVEGAEPNEVIKEFQKGYILNGRVLRASKVVVASDKQ